MREAIENALRPLIGLPVWGTHRAAGMQTFQFGRQNLTTNRKGEAAAIGDYGLHLQCPWRIVGPEGIVVGSTDMEYAAGDDPYGVPPDYDFYKPGASLRDERMNLLFGERRDDPFVVVDIFADALGGMTLTLSEGYVLQAFPCHSRPDEFWRLLDNLSVGRPHFVVEGTGFDIVYESGEI